MRPNGRLTTTKRAGECDQVGGYLRQKGRCPEMRPNGRKWHVKSHLIARKRPVSAASAGICVVPSRKCDQAGGRTTPIRWKPCTLVQPNATKRAALTRRLAVRVRSHMMSVYEPDPFTNYQRRRLPQGC